MALPRAGALVRSLRAAGRATGAAARSVAGVARRVWRPKAPPPVPGLYETPDTYLASGEAATRALIGIYAGAGGGASLVVQEAILAAGRQGAVVVLARPPEAHSALSVMVPTEVTDPEVGRRLARAGLARVFAEAGAQAMEEWTWVG